MTEGHRSTDRDRGVTGPVAAGRAEIARRRWLAGHQLLTEAAAQQPLDGAALDALADAALALGILDEYREVVEQAHSTHLVEGDVQRAAAEAVKLSMFFVRRGDLALAGGWLGTAAGLLEDEPDEGVGTALVAFAQSAFATVGGDLAAAEQLAQRAIGLGRRIRNLDVQTLGRVVLGEVRARQGRADEAGPLLDQVMAMALGPGLSPWASCMVLCRTMIACQATGDLPRAQQWVDATREAHHGDAPAPLSGDCRVHHAGLLNWRGEWAEAVREAEMGVSELPRDLMHQGMAAYERGEMLLQQGDVVGAEESLARAHELGRAPQPALARTYLADGRGSAALAALESALEDERAPVLRAPLLEAQVEIALAEGRSDVAGAASAELAQLAGSMSAPLVSALAASARGEVHLTDGDLPAACSTLRDAVRRWTAMNAPYRAARTRMLLADAYARRGDRDSAVLELQTARTTFDRLGAQPDAARAARAVRALAPDASPTAARHVHRTFLFTDIVRSTPLVEALGDDAWADLLRWHDATLRAHFTAHGGQEVDHAGDGFFVVFQNPAAAVRCAVAVQSGLAAHRRTAGFAPQVRIGIHAQEALGGDDGYRGHGVHVAARVGAEAGAGEILVSAGTLDGAGVDVETGAPRTARLKGVADAVVLLPVVWS
jgi:class 3 adenylate cyclase